jgi:hypothetical protein
MAAASAILAIAGIVNALNDTGAPAVMDPRTGSVTDQLHPGQDILFVKGSWVFDTAHEGWNEIHPIKLCQLVGRVRFLGADWIDWDHAIGPFMVSISKWKYDLADPADPGFVKSSGPPTADDWRAWVAALCDAAEHATSTTTTGLQSQPQNTWELHPLVDGCRPADDPHRNPDNVSPIH